MHRLSFNLFNISNKGVVYFIVNKSMAEFIAGQSIGVYLFIFFGKILEVTLATIRMVLINRGERTKGSFLAFFEVIVWLVVTSTVLSGFQSDLWKVLVYAVAFSIGNYLGSYLEGVIALGLSSIQVITSENEKLDDLLTCLRSNNVAVTVINGEGKEGDKKILFIHLKRKRIAEIVKLINSVSDNCVISVSDIKVLRGGFIKK